MVGRRRAGALLTELSKLCSLRVVRGAAAVTVLAAAAIGYAQAAGFAEAHRAEGVEPVVASTLSAIPFAQAGMIVIGVVPLGHEYAGRVLRTSLAAVPSRWALVRAKTLALLLVSFAVAVLAVAAEWVGAASAEADGAAFGAVGDGLGEAVREAEWGRIAGAVAYLVLMALLAHAIALLLGGLVQGLVASLALVLLIPPLLSGLGRVAGWLPDRAAAVLFSGPSESLPTWGGALVAAEWTAALLACGGVRFARTDP